MSKSTLNLSNLIQTPFKPQLVELKNHVFPYMRINIPIPKIDPLAWLESQTRYPKIYFENPKTSIKVAGVGAAYTLNEIPSFISCIASPRFFGGMDFFERKGKLWEGFPTCRYILPAVEIEVRGNQTYLCINRTSEAFDLSDIHFTEINIRYSHQKPTRRFDTPSPFIWHQSIHNSFKLMSKKKLDKIVLARLSSFEFEKDLSPFAFCKLLQGKSPASTLFIYQFSKQNTFLGATPESLYSRKKLFLETKAIAGTRRRGRTNEEDQALQTDLLTNPKEIHEFNIVKETIEKRLTSLCTHLKKQSHNSIIQTSTVQHISHHFKALLNEGIDDESIIKALHPTPAVGGYPKKRALDEMQRLETFDRGWYAAPVGWISQNDAHLLVAIRSALIRKNYLHLFAGTGIVPTSSPQKEWEELEHKISQFILW